MNKIEIPWPEHKCGMYITHNRHRDYYETVQEAIEYETYDRTDFINEAEITECIAKDQVWELQWFPRTPVGSYTVCASTLERALEIAKQVDSQ